MIEDLIKVKAIVDFTDFLGKEVDYLKNEYIARIKDDVFSCGKQRAEYLEKNKVVIILKEDEEKIIKEPVEDYKTEKVVKKTRKKKENK